MLNSAAGATTGTDLGAEANAVVRQREMMVCAALAIITYAATIGFGFALDDLWMVAGNRLLTSLRSVPRFFAAPYINYRPLVLVNFTLDYQLASLHAWFYHAENIILHALNTVLVYLVVARLFPRRAWITAALFAVLPVHTEVAANVVGRSELLATLFGLWALLVALSARNAMFAGLLFLLALFGKESAVAVPALALLLFAAQRWLLPENEANSGTVSAHSYPRAGRVAQVLAWFCAALLVYLAVRRIAYGVFFWPDAAYPGHEVHNPLLLVDAATRVRTALVILAENLAICLVPYHLSADYSMWQIPPVSSFADHAFLGAVLALVAACAACAFAARRRPAVAVGLAWFLLSIAPVSNLAFPIGVMRAERLLYLPSAGICLIVADLVVAARKRRASLGMVLLAIVIAGNAVVAVRRSFVWRNHPAVVASMLADAPNSANAHYLAGMLYLERRDCDNAVLELRRALRIYPGFAIARDALRSCVAIAPGSER